MGGGAAEPPPAPRRRARLLLREGAARLPGGAAPPAAAPPHLCARGGSAPAGCWRLSRRRLCGGHRRQRDPGHRAGTCRRSAPGGNERGGRCPRARRGEAAQLRARRRRAPGKVAAEPPAGSCSAAGTAPARSAAGRGCCPALSLPLRRQRLRVCSLVFLGVWVCFSCLPARSASAWRGPRTSLSVAGLFPFALLVEFCATLLPSSVCGNWLWLCWGTKLVSLV